MKYLIATFHVMNYNESEIYVNDIFPFMNGWQKTDSLPETGRESVSSYCKIRQTGKKGQATA